MSYLTAPSTVRRCDRPGCDARYDAAAVLSGQERADGWRRLTTFGLDMCPQDAALWAGDEDTHRPVLNREAGTGSCSCGETLTTSRAPLGDINAAYLAHLTRVVGKRRNPTTRSPHATADPAGNGPAPATGDAASTNRSTNR